MDRRLLYIRIVLWIGIVADLMNLILYAFPQLIATQLGIANPQIDSITSYILIQTGTLMLGWTLLLFWADRKPIERKVVLLLTSLVTVGMFLSAIYLIVSGTVVFITVLPLIILPIVLCILFTSAYLLALGISKEKH